MKIIFLDIDGVILAGRHLWSADGFATSDGRNITRKQDHTALPADTVAVLRHVIARTGAQLVLSSTWRLHADAQKHMADAYIRPFHPDWRTDNAYHDGDQMRGAQIQRWLDAHPDVSAYAILDDDSDMLPSQLTHFMNLPSRASSEGVSPQAARWLSEARPFRPGDCLKGSGGLDRPLSSSAQCKITSAAA